MRTMSVAAQIDEGTLLAARYQVLAFLGEGSFGKVAKCVDNVTNTQVAIKISKDRPDLTAQVEKEIQILELLRTLDPDKLHLVRWHSSFFHDALICLTFELLDLNLYDYMKERRFKPLTMAEIRPVLHQLNSALLHLNDLRIIHRDIKPENIMAVDREQQRLHVKLIDFGLACHVSSVVQGSHVQSLWYRSPEVILGLLYSIPIDIWSLGLVAAELALGCVLFPGKHEYDMMKFIMSMFGQLPDHLLEIGSKSIRFFNVRNQTWSLKTPEEFAALTGHHHSDTRCFQSLDALEKLMYFLHNAEKKREVHLFMDLFKKMLLVDDFRRISPDKMPGHPFFSVEQHTDISAMLAKQEAAHTQPGTLDFTDGSLNEFSQNCQIIMSKDNLLTVRLGDGRMWTDRCGQK